MYCVSVSADTGLSSLRYLVGGILFGEVLCCVPDVAFDGEVLTIEFFFLLFLFSDSSFASVSVVKWSSAQGVYLDNEVLSSEVFFYHSCYLVSEVLSHEISSAASLAWFSCAKWSSVLDIYLHNEVLSRKFFFNHVTRLGKFCHEILCGVTFLDSVLLKWSSVLDIYLHNEVLSMEVFISFMLLDQWSFI